VALPRESFCADYDRGFHGGDGFEQIDPLLEIVSYDIGGVSAFSESSEFFPEEIVLNTLAAEEVLKVLLSEYR
jgi:hypothetical protein